MEEGRLNFPRSSLTLAAEYREAGFSDRDANRLAKGHVLIAKVENATSIDDLRDVVRDLVRDLYQLGYPVPPWSKPEPEDQAPPAPSR